MMTVVTKVLRDDAARRDAINILDRSILVEAGAGSGKTAVMAGRIAVLLAEGIAPKRIAAVTFTELAASELLVRVRDFVHDLASGHVAPELRVALPHGLSQTQRDNLAVATATLDEITCSTIHGFCQRLIKPYPVEADIDPGARVMDRNEGDLAFTELVDAWLHERLATGEGGIIAELVLENPGRAVDLIRAIANTLRHQRTVSGPPAPAIATRVEAFRDAADAFFAFVRSAPADEPETAAIAARLYDMARALAAGPPADTPAGLVRLLVSKPHPDLCMKGGAFSAYKKKGKWIDASRQVGLAKADAERLNAAAEDHYAACRDAWTAMMEAVAAHVLSDLIREVRPVLTRFRDYKRSAALLDFDDLIHGARDLLRDHEAVCQALSRRFAHVLVDEFQDTDPLQTEIFWRLCGDPPEGADPRDWSTYRIRAGALFLVGDPKQAIYRFRGADVRAYVRARAAFHLQNPDSILSISTNFRSRAPILDYVNARFSTILSGEGQPGFTALDPFHGNHGPALSVAVLDVTAADENGKAGADRKRDAEAEAVAEMCARLIGSESIVDRRTGEARPCRPGDIALLAPTGNDLWRYEEALEQKGIPVATQAGKGLYRRQEIQDLIALTRVLADRRDTLALGALLRGPLVGLTEAELLDIVWALPRTGDDPKIVPRLHLGVDASAITHPLARATLEKLQSLYRRTNSTTPRDLLSQAVDVMRVRPILLARHRGQAERALANVDLYLSLATPYAVRGLRAFAEAMTAAWTDEERAVEGRPDAQEDAVALYTMHAAKGLEWPVVIPINCMSEIFQREGPVTDRDSDIFFCPVFGVHPTGYDAARDAEQEELERERIRLWYVAATRARELLVLPRFDVPPSDKAWISLLDLSLAELPLLDLAHLPADLGNAADAPSNLQTRESFAQEAAFIAEHWARLTWLAPSRDEGGGVSLLQPEAVEVWAGDESGQPTDAHAVPAIQGGRERGLILHKLFEEVLTGETADDAATLAARARDLIVAVGKPVAADPAHGLSPVELAGCVTRTLALPQIAELRPSLVPEFPVYASTRSEKDEQVTAGIADAISLTANGRPQAVVDWKSDVAPTTETIVHYRAQVRTYLDMTGAERGLVVLVTSGAIIEVVPSPAPT